MDERALRHALDRRELRLHFQPVVRASSGQVVGAEALVRWQHPTRGLLAPVAFLRTAERVGLLDAIGEWVLEEAIAQRATWPPGCFVSVNLSPSELASAPDRDLVGRIDRACVRHGVAVADLWVEVTEQPILAPEPTRATLRALNSLGAKVVLDDFGAGQASLARLRDLPFDICKLDRSFVAGLAEAGGTRVVRAAVAMARALGTEVVAEGIETPEQLEQVDVLGCDLLQGYHLSRPVPVGQLRELLEHQAQVTPHRVVDGPRAAQPAGPPRAGAKRDHRVLYYGDDAALVGWVADALVPALAAGDAAVTVVTGQHRRLIAAELTARGVDVPAAVADGQLVQFDAATTLDLIMEDGLPVAERIAELVAQLVPADGRTLWAFGEMVALLWQRGHVTAAMALEESWNACVEHAPVALLCAYPSVEVAADGGGAFERIAQHHSEVCFDGTSWQVDADAVARDPARYVQQLRSALAATAEAAGAKARLEAELTDLRRRTEASELFGAMVVHEIRNPASVLTLALDALAREHALDADAQHLLELATASADAISRFAADLLLANSLDATGFTVRRAPFQLAQTIRAAVERTRLVSGRSIHCDLPRELPRALGDDERQRQILLNLLDNAVACSPPDTAIDVWCSIEADQLVIRVADRGPGIAVEDQSRLFEPFSRLGAAHERPTGAGLGLHIVDRLVRAQGGAVWVEDGPVGGAVFCVTVPRATPAGRAAAPLAAPVAAATQREVGRTS